MADDVDYARIVIEKYDKNSKNKINFLEFCKYMEDMWETKDNINQQKCNSALNKSKNILYHLFKWLDRDHDGSVTPEDLIYGLSRILVRDVDMKEVIIIFFENQIQKTFTKYDTSKTGKLSFDIFMLAISNGYLDKTIKDILMTDNYIL